MAGRAATLRIDVLADTSKAQRELAGFSGVVAGITAKGADILSGWVSQAGSMALQFGEDAYNMAIAAQKTTNELARVFKGPALDAIKEFDSHAVDTLNTTSNVADEIAAKLGRLVLSYGIPQKQAEAITEQVMKRAADAAAATGLSLDQVVGDFESVIRGKFRPAAELGIGTVQSLAKANLEALDPHHKLTGAALDQAKAYANLSALLQTTQGDVGALGKYMDTTAGKTDHLSNEWKQMQLTLGGYLIPAMAVAIAVLNEWMVFLSFASGELEVFVGQIEWVASTIFGAFTDAFNWAIGLIKSMVKGLQDLSKAFSLGGIGSIFGGVFSGHSAGGGGGAPSVSALGAPSTYSGGSTGYSSAGVGTVNIYGQVSGDQVVAALIRYTNRRGSLSTAGVRI